MTQIVTFSISKHLLDKMDTRRGDIPRSRYITRLLEDAMNQKNKSDQYNGNDLN